MDDDGFNRKDIRELSSFVFDNVFQSKEEIKEELRKFQNDSNDEFDCIEERVFVQNIISYLQWRLKDIENAYKSVKIAENLQKKPHLVTHCNKVIFYLESGEHYLSNKLSKELKNNDHFKQTRTKLQVKAEIGYCYSRLGPKHYDKATKLFKEAIAYITPERNILWEFRLSLCLRRQTDMFQTTTPAGIIKPAENTKEAARLLNGILNFKTNNDCYLKTKAKACCKLSNILLGGKNLFQIIHTDKEETEKVTECWCFEEAMKLCPNQYFVLLHYGIYLRYTLDLEKSKEMLERAVRIKDSSFLRHHLAITLKRMVERSTFAEERDSPSVGLGQHVDNSSNYKVVHVELNIKFPSTSTSIKYTESIFLHKRKLAKYYCDQASTSDRKDTFFSATMSPKCVSPDNPLVMQAVEHLQKAIEMSKKFDCSRYQLGLIYRMLDRPNDALKCFSFITLNKWGNSSEYSMNVNKAFRQQLQCKLDLLAKETNPVKKNGLRYDAKKCAWNVLKNAPKLICTISTLKRTIHYYLALIKLLKNEKDSYTKIKEELELNKLIESIFLTVRFPKNIRRVESELTSRGQKYERVRYFKNGICFLSVQQSISEVYISDKSSYVKKYIKKAKDFVFKRNLEMANTKFTEAYKVIFSHQNVSIPRNEEDETSLDILVLHSCDEDWCCYQNFVISTLETFVQLEFAVNDDYCPPSHRRFEYLIKTMDKSHCILIIHHKSKSGNDTGHTDEFIDRVMEIACVKHHKKILQIRTQEVEQNATGCKEIVLTCSPCDIVNTDSSRQILLKGKLFYNMLYELSEMFLR